MIKKEWLFMQTPKEKAEDLIQKFYKWVATPDDKNIEFYKSKECAKLHINLVLESEVLKPSNNLVIEYYQEVLKEIEKL